MDLYFKRHDGEAATVEDFIRCFEEAAAVDLGQFRLWYSQAGTPELVVKSHFDAAAKCFTLEVEQIVPPTPGQPRKQPTHIPLRLGLVGKDGTDLALKLADGTEIDGDLLHIRKRRESFRFAGVAARPVPSLLRGFSAPVRVTSNASDDDLLFLLAHDGDRFNRWQAAHGYATRRLLAACALIRKGKAPGVAEAFTAALETALGDDSLEPAFRSQLLDIPPEADLHMAIGHDVDPDIVHEARNWLKGELAGRLDGLLRQIYANERPEGPYSPDAEAAGKRALRNAALGLLATTGDDDAARLVASHYDGADNMTDMAAALAIITHIDHEERARLLGAFFDRFKGDSLVVDKWLALNAISSLPGAAARVSGLMELDLFSLNNPNRVRALAGSFAMLNATGFHAADGAGYELIADTVIALDPINPQVAARTLGAFRNWRMMEPKRRAMAEKELRRVAERDDLSRDTGEIARRSIDPES
jgi:aminopeptidase N